MAHRQVGAPARYGGRTYTVDSVSSRSRHRTARSHHPLMKPRCLYLYLRLLILSTSFKSRLPARRPVGGATPMRAFRLDSSLRSIRGSAPCRVHGVAGSATSSRWHLPQRLLRDGAYGRVELRAVSPISLARSRADITRRLVTPRSLEISARSIASRDLGERLAVEQSRHVSVMRRSSRDCRSQRVAPTSLRARERGQQAAQLHSERDVIASWRECVGGGGRALRRRSARGRARHAARRGTSDLPHARHVAFRNPQSSYFKISLDP